MPKKLTLFLFALLLIPPAVSGAVTIGIDSNRDKIFLGESFNLTLSVNGADENIEQPDFSESSPAEITLLGSHSNSRSSIQIINGQVTRDVFKGRVLTYAIRPKQAGLYRTGTITVRVNGQTHRHPGTVIDVKGVEKQDTVIVAVKASSTAVLVEEPFTITLEIAVRELPDPYWKTNEPLHADFMPHITAGFLEITDEKDDLKRPDLNRILNALIDQSGRKPSFRINSYRSRGMSFGSLFDSDPFRERPLRFLLQQEHSQIHDVRYRKYTLTLRYTATAEGQHTFGPVTFKGEVISGVTAERQAQMTEIYAIGPAVTVRVTPPPDEGRPEEFIGSVGKNITAAAQLDTNICKVGDPLTLTLSVTGDISISNMRTPLLNLQPELTENFRIYDDNVKTETLANGKRFSYRVRPTTAGTLEFPPIRIAYYDTDAKAYKTAATQPLPLQAEYTAQISAGREGGIVEIKKTLPLPCGITLAESGIRNETLLPDRRAILILLLSAPLLTLLTLLLPQLLRVVRLLHSRRRHGGALARALRAIGRARTATELAQALRSWFTARMEVAGHSLTANDSARTLAEHRVPAEICQAMAALIATLDEAIYRPCAGGELPRRQCAEILKRADRALSARPAESEEERI